MYFIHVNEFSVGPSFGKKNRGETAQLTRVIPSVQCSGWRVQNHVLNGGVVKHEKTVVYLTYGPYRKTTSIC